LKCNFLNELNSKADLVK